MKYLLKKKDKKRLKKIMIHATTLAVNGLLLMLVWNKLIIDLVDIPNPITYSQGILLAYAINFLKR